MCGAHRSYEFGYNPFNISNNLLHLQELVKISFKSLNQTKKELGKGGHFWKDFKENLVVWYINRKLVFLFVLQYCGGNLTFFRPFYGVWMWIKYFLNVQLVFLKTILTWLRYFYLILFLLNCVKLAMVPAFPNYSQELKIRVFKMFPLDRHFPIWRIISIYLMETPMLYLILVLYTYLMFHIFTLGFFFKT